MDSDEEVDHLLSRMAKLSEDHLISRRAKLSEEIREKEKARQSFDQDYVILGLPSGAKLSDREIEKAYLSKIAELDPDKRPDDPNAHRDFVNVCASYNLFREKKEKARSRLRDILTSRSRDAQLSRSRDAQFDTSTLHQRRMWLRYCLIHRIPDV